MKLTKIESLRNGEIAAAIPGASPLDGQIVKRDAPDEMWLLCAPDGQAAARGIRRPSRRNPRSP